MSKNLKAFELQHQCRFDDNRVETYDNLYEKTDHGQLDYPVSVYYLDLEKSYLKYIRWHWHEEMEILIINSGTAEVSTDDATCMIRPGQGIVINQNVMHSIHSVGDTNCTFYSIVFHPDYIFGHKSNNLQAKYLLPVHNLRLFKLLLLDEQNEWHEKMLNAVNETIAYHSTKPFGYEIAVMSHLCQFWFLLVSRLPQVHTAPAPKVSLDEQRVKQAMHFIRTHYAEPISLNDIADSIHISRSECCRCFARTLQMSPFEYLMKCRIFEATRTLLEHPDENVSIAELSTSVGFNNTSYFNKLFKKYLGCTPTYYRTHFVLAGKEQDDGPFTIPLL